jgi:hypothetical protein
MLEPDYKKEAMKFASVSEHDIERISDAWKEFGSNQGAWIAIMFFEMIAIKSE